MVEVKCHKPSSEWCLGGETVCRKNGVACTHRSNLPAYVPGTVGMGAVLRRGNGLNKRLTGSSSRTLTHLRNRFFPSNLLPSLALPLPIPLPLPVPFPLPFPLPLFSLPFPLPPPPLPLTPSHPILLFLTLPLPPHFTYSQPSPPCPPLFPSTS
ncbi:unnamed protein product [Closterium sp. NIES-64]|nr:unnamed protein product [Closterium sp. NIES-64]